MTYTVTWSHAAARAVRETLPETVAAAAIGFILGPLAENPQRVGSPLRAPLDSLHSARRGEY